MPWIWYAASLVTSRPGKWTYLPLSFRDKMNNMIKDMETHSVTLRLWGTRYRVPYGTRESALWDEGEPYSRGEWPWSMNRKEKPKVALKWLDGASSVCARFTLARLNFDSESSASHDEMRLLDLFATQSNKSNNILINLDVCLEVPPWLDSRCLHRMVNQLESWKLKLESKDLLFIAFQQRKTRASQSLA